MQSKILVVEDSPESLELVRRALGRGLQLDCARTLAQAVQLINQNLYDLILLDVVLPDGDGFNLCSLLHAKSDMKTPVIFLTAKNSISDKILGFQIGAEDFITKPFDPIELKARVESRLRKREREKVESDYIRAGGLEINKTAQSVTAFADQKETKFDLTQIEFKLLVLFAQRPGAVISRDEALDIVWGANTHVDHRSVDTHIAKLRKKLGSFATRIESVHGSGYRFVNDTADQGLSVISAVGQSTSDNINLINLY